MTNSTEMASQFIDPTIVIEGSPEVSASSNNPKAVILPQAGNGECSCGGGYDSPTSPDYIYALGRIGWRFPSQSVEKEFAQATGRTETAGLTDRQAMHAVLSNRQNRYLIRQLCWVLSIEGLKLISCNHGILQTRSC